ncbi:MAG: hypothetical protein JJT87_17740 [Halomonas sp.]|nr:hypothetical protein [Halomonas sp.]MCC5903760.1 hypothetical protein [Halomonas sp.]
MNFHNSTHRHYCGIDLHARSLYVCILRETLLHKELPARPEPLLRLIEIYLDDGDQRRMHVLLVLDR